MEVATRYARRREERNAEKPKTWKSSERDTEFVENLDWQRWDKSGQNEVERSFSQGRQQISEEHRREQVGSHAGGGADLYNAGREGQEEDEAPGMEVSVVWMGQPSEAFDAAQVQPDQELALHCEEDAETHG